MVGVCFSIKIILIAKHVTLFITNCITEQWFSRASPNPLIANILQHPCVAVNWKVPAVSSPLQTTRSSTTTMQTAPGSSPPQTWPRYHPSIYRSSRPIEQSRCQFVFNKIGMHFANRKAAEDSVVISSRSQWSSISWTHCVAHEMTETKAGRLVRGRQRRVALCHLWDGGEKERERGERYR